MFFRDKKKKQDRRVSVAGAHRSIPSIISSGLIVHGDLRTEGNIEVDGEVDGNIYCNIVTVRRDGNVKGNISANEIFIDGSANGMIKGKNIFVAPGATVSGILFYDTLTVRDGASLNAQCKNLSELKKSKDTTASDADENSDDGESEEDFFEEMTLSSADERISVQRDSDDFLYSESIGAEDDDEAAESDLTAAEYDIDTDIYEKHDRSSDAVISSGSRVSYTQDITDESDSSDRDTVIFGGAVSIDGADDISDTQRKEPA